VARLRCQRVTARRGVPTLLASLRRQLATLLDQDDITETRPEPCTHCDYCEFNPLCDAQWRNEDSLVYVANIRTPERHALEREGVRTVVELSTRAGSVPELHDENLERLVARPLSRSLRANTPKSAGL